MDDVEIRGYEERDRRAVIDLWERCELTRTWNDPDRDIARKTDHADDMFLVAVRRERVVGTVMAGYDGHRGWINYLAVDPREQGKHLGSHLMDAAERCLGNLGCAKINLQIRRSNVGARSFYERLGYVQDEVISMGKHLIVDPTDETPRSSAGRWHDDDEITGGDDEELLHGGVANAGAVVRSGGHVLRPSNQHSASIHSFLTRIRSSGFHGASEPVSIDSDGRERLRFVPGDVALAPYPAWAQTDEALASVAVLIRGLHDASVGLSLDGESWSSELADPDGGPVVCHNDVCLENVVFRDGTAVALLDFDFAAPGRREFDLAAFARMCAPIDDEVNASRLGWASIDKPKRLRVVCDAYGCDSSGRAAVLACLSDSIARGGEFVRRRVDAGEVAFIEMWNNMGGQERFDRRREWWLQSHRDFTDALG